MQRSQIANLAQDLVIAQRVNGPPVPIEAIVASQGLFIVQSSNSSSDISGFITYENSRTIIGVNSAHSETRQRFTIAHELGHYLLHPHSNQVHVDKRFHAQFRDSLSSKGTDKQEREANLFAAEILMPRFLLQNDLSLVSSFDLLEEETVRHLAKKYKVSYQSMLLRLTNLGYVSL